eukprot:TRINITY_DN17418_c0_g1_i1.p1 TRINITY_DN17418_c0_g1~~TRINITY_DN17418_c0_g1_i1.p1  ORF type:complete len:143 (+),score=11.51 TRINITY_DN17418_c0_g1_i1:198-626(+)
MIYAIVNYFTRTHMRFDFSTVFATYCTIVLFVAILLNAKNGADINDVSKIHRLTVLQWRERVAKRFVLKVVSSYKDTVEYQRAREALNVAQQHLTEATMYDFRLWGFYLDSNRLLGLFWVSLTVLVSYMSAVGANFITKIDV